MIYIEDKALCCGCSACEQICPRSCIRMEEDSEGFLYPVVAAEDCINCKLCEKVCPVLNRYPAKEEPLKCYLGKTTDEIIRSHSSSGGIFAEVANFVIQKGGVVFGVRFDDHWNAIYGYTESTSGLKTFYGSKYVQANPRKAYTLAKKFLSEGRIVLYSGTPCVIAGLNHFLQKKYDNLITLDIVCHSIPSAKIWGKYLLELSKQNDAIVKDVSFRNKSNTWSHYSLCVTMETSSGETIHMVEPKEKNAYMRGFLNDLYTRPSCEQCPARNYTSESDITLADAWGINKFHPELNDEKGISHVLINSERGAQVFNSLETCLNCICIRYDEVLPHSLHLPLIKSSKHNPYRQDFFRMISLGQTVEDASNELLNLYDAEMVKKNRRWDFLRSLPFFSILLKIKSYIRR